jgi:hypothetical protein
MQHHGFFYFCASMKPNQTDTVLLSTAYLGPVEYFYYINKFKNVIIEQHETWPKQTYRNRTVIVTDKGTIPLTVPVTKVNGNHTKTRDIVVSAHEKWHIKQWRAIETAYQNSPYFLFYADEIKEILFSGTGNLLELNTNLTKHICKTIGIDSKLTLSENFIKNPDKSILDLRYKISPKLPSTLMQFPSYIQVFSDKQPFFPNAGILDLLFCTGPESKDYLDRL